MRDIETLIRMNDIAADREIRERREVIQEERDRIIRALVHEGGDADGQISLQRVFEIVNNVQETK